MMYKCFDLVTMSMWGRKLKGMVTGVLYTSPVVYTVKTERGVYDTTADKLQPLAANEA